MAITLTAGTPSSSTTPSDTTITANVPGSLPGDISYIGVSINCSAAGFAGGSPPTGWTLVQGNQPTNTTAGYFGIIRRVWQPGDPSTITLTAAAAGRISAGPVLVRGADTTAPEFASDITRSGTIANGGNLPCPTLTATLTSQVLLVGYGLRTTATTGAANTFTQPSGMTELIDEDANVAGGVTNTMVGMASLALSSTGATGVKNALPAAGGQGVGVSILLSVSTATGLIGFTSLVTSLSGTLTRVAISPKAETLTDDFSGTLAKWPGSFGGAAISGGRAVLPTISTYSALLTSAVYDLTNSYVYADIVMPSQPGNGTKELFFEFKVDTNNSVSFFMSGSTSLVMRRRTAGTNSDTSIAYNSATHLWLRIAEAAGTLTWDTSPDSVTWTNQRTVSHALTLTAGVVNIETGYYGTESADSASVDNVNTSNTSIKALVGSASLTTSLSGTPTKTLAPISTLTTDFTVTATWDVSVQDVTVSATKATLVATDFVPHLLTVPRYSLLASSFTFQVTAWPQFTGGSHNADAQVNLRVNGSDANRLMFLFDNDNLYIRYVVANATTTLATVTLPVSGTYFRLREAAGTVYWETSADYSSWNTEGSWVHAGAIDLGNLEVAVFVTGASPAPGDGEFWFEHVNEAGGTTKAVTGSTGLSTTLSATLTRDRAETGATTGLTTALTGTPTRELGLTGATTGLVTALSSALVRDRAETGATTSLVVGLAATLSTQGVTQLNGTVAVVIGVSGDLTRARTVLLSGSTSLVTSLAADIARAALVDGTVAVRVTSASGNHLARARAVQGQTGLSTGLTGIPTRYSVTLVEGNLAVVVAVQDGMGPDRERAVDGATSLVISTSSPLPRRTSRVTGETGLVIDLMGQPPILDMTVQGSTALVTGFTGRLVRYRPDLPGSVWLEVTVRPDSEQPGGDVLELTVPIYQEA